MNTSIVVTGSTARTVRHTLGLTALAAPLAAAITLGAGVAAHADEQPALTTVIALDGGTVNPDLPQGPGELTADPSCPELGICGGGGGEDPEPTVDPDLPGGSGGLTTEEDCHQFDTCPPGPGGEEPEGTVDPDLPGGSGGLTTEEDCHQFDTCPPGDGGDDGDEDGVEDGGDQGDGGGETPGDDGHDGSGDGVDKPTRIDAGSATDDGLRLAWALPGGLLVSAAGLAFAARRTRGAEGA